MSAAPPDEQLAASQNPSVVANHEIGVPGNAGFQPARRRRGKMERKIAVVLLTLLFVSLQASAHEHNPPHKGTLVVFGKEFAHLELVLDAATGKLTAYALDGEAEKAVRLKQSEIVIEIKGVKDLTSVTLKAQGSELSGEKPGDTSEFSATDAKLKGVKEFDGVVKALNIRGTDFKDEKFNFPKGNE
jgi:hypothetical protein